MDNLAKRYPKGLIQLITEPTVMGMLAFISALKPEASAPIAVGVTTWQIYNFERFKDQVEKRFAQRCITNLENVQSPESIDLIYRIVESAKNSASIYKCRALANCLVNSFTLPTNQDIGKATIARLIEQMSDSEMLLLGALSELEERQAPNNLRITTTENIADYLNWSINDVVMMCEGLLQLGLSVDASTDIMRVNGEFHIVQHGYFSRGAWRCSLLGMRVKKFAIDFSKPITDIENL